MTTFTAKGLTTRARIIDGAAAQIREHGISTTTLDDVLARTRTSKGQLFHYFPGGREELLLAVAEHEARRVIDDQQPHLARLDSWQAWQDWRDAVVDRYRRQGTTCPLAALMTELGRATPAARALTVSLFERWQHDLTAGVLAMRGRGLVAPGVDAEQAGRALLAGIQGGVAIMLATGELAHLEAALDIGIAHLRTPSGR